MISDSQIFLALAVALVASILAVRLGAELYQ
uniref:Photosystem I reaction center subunit XII n=1 Tax=Haptophyceae sp. NIES-3900 TaxID=2748608 RepID=A0A7R6WD39_9EUKA|nr:photosystem I reaction center subunit M [Haptophyceae sp. NIES-3900]